MEDTQLEKFDPTVAELKSMVKATKDITATDLKDKAQLEIVRKSRINLKNARVKITKIGKDLREDANAFQKKVIAKEKELIAIIEPEEDRLEAIEKEAEALAIREERTEKLPLRKERLLKINAVDSWATDEELLAMDSEQFEAFFNQSVAQHNEVTARKAEEERLKQAEADRMARAEEDRKREEENARIKAEQDKKQAELDAKEQKLRDEQREIEHKKEVKAAEERAKKVAKEEADQKEKERLDVEKKAKADALAEEKRIVAEKKAEEAKLAKQKDYLDFLKSVGYTQANKADFKREETATHYVLYKKVGEFKK